MKKVLYAIFSALVLVILISCTDLPGDDVTKTLVGLELIESPTKTTFEEGEVFSLEGAIINANYELSDGTTDTKDVTSLVTFSDAALLVSDTKVVVSYTEKGVTKTLDITITVTALEENLIGDGLVMDLPDTLLSVAASATSGDAISYWDVTYTDDGLKLVVVVKDPSIDLGTSTYNSDGIEVLVYKVGRYLDLEDNTLLINASVRDDLVVKKALNNDFVVLENHDVTHSYEVVSFDGTYIEGYKIELLIPYLLLDTNKLDKDITFLPGLYNNNGLFANIEYLDDYDANPELTRTFVWITDDNTFLVNPWVQLGATFGSYGNLTYTDNWDLSHDDGTENAYIEINNVKTGTDNNIYMYGEDATNLYAYVKLSAKEVFNNEKYGKFGLIVTTPSGKDGFLFFVDALGDGTNMTGTNIGIVNQENGDWKWPEKMIASLTSKDDYQDDNFVELAIYREGSIFEFFVNGESVSIMGGFPNIENDTKAVVGLVSFNITIKAKDYGITTDSAVLDDYRFSPEPITNLFIGDSYVDTFFWNSFNFDFDGESQNLGVGGTKVDYWKNQVPVLNTLFTPENIIIHIGVNDINDGNIEGSIVLDNLTILFDLLKESYPDVDIYFISIEPNNFRPNNFSKYMAVNNGVINLANEYNYLHYIDTVTPLGGESGPSVARYFHPDGLHLNPDGYGIWVREIKKALGIDYIDSQDGLGDFGEYAKSTGWVYEDDYVENQFGLEQQIYFEDAMGIDYAISVDINVKEAYYNDLFPKTGFAIKGVSKTVLFFIDVQQPNNPWANYVVRKSGFDWDWADTSSRQFVYTKANSYIDENYKTFELIKVGTAIYFIADGEVIQYAEGLFDIDEVTQMSVMSFNLKVRLKNAITFVGDDLAQKLLTYKISAKDGPKIDGNLNDWDEDVLDNYVEIIGSDDRIIKVYGQLANDGVYLAAVGLHETPLINNVFNWWENTNFEFKIGSDNQRFVAANGFFSRWEFGGSRDVGTAKYTTLSLGNLNQTTFEIFVPWAFIDGYDANTQVIPAGFAWKQPGEEGSIWANGDFWYVPEADPGFRTRLITKDGINPYELLVDLDELSENVLTNKSSASDDDRTMTMYAYLDDIGLRVLYHVALNDPLSFDGYNRADDWWKNPNFEIWANDQHSRIMFYGDNIYATGRISNVDYRYEADTNELVVEALIPYLNLGILTKPESIFVRSGSANVNGGWIMPLDPNTIVTIDGIIK